MRSRKHFTRRDIKQNFAVSPVCLTRLSTSKRAIYLITRGTELNLLVANVMEDGYANTAEFSSVAPLPCMYTRKCTAFIKTTRTYAKNSPERNFD